MASALHHDSSGRPRLMTGFGSLRVLAHGQPDPRYLTQSCARSDAISPRSFDDRVRQVFRAVDGAW